MPQHTRPVFSAAMRVDPRAEEKIENDRTVCRKSNVLQDRRKFPLPDAGPETVQIPGVRGLDGNQCRASHGWDSTRYRKPIRGISNLCSCCQVKRSFRISVYLGSNTRAEAFNVCCSKWPSPALVRCNRNPQRYCVTRPRTQACLVVHQRQLPCA